MRVATMIRTNLIAGVGLWRHAGIYVSVWAWPAWAVAQRIENGEERGKNEAHQAGFELEPRW